MDPIPVRQGVPNRLEGAAVADPEPVERLSAPRRSHRFDRFTASDRTAVERRVRFPLGVSLHTLDREQRLETIHLLNGSAVRAVELWEPTFNKEEAFVVQAREALAGAGVEPRTVHVNFGGALDLSSSDPAVRAAGIEAVRRALDLAVRMGAGILVVHPSAEPIEDRDRPARMAWAKESIQRVADLVRAAGRRAAFELLPRTCLGRSIAELQSLLREAPAESVGICLDTNHLRGPSTTRRASRARRRPNASQPSKPTSPGSMSPRPDREAQRSTAAGTRLAAGRAPDRVSSFFAINSHPPPGARCDGAAGSFHR
ncbi:MAG: sugar phosphate isomerase/epimerase [Lentisphaeria bacterium]|nr:sugar phosphate isomerase/epimerase [Lentisphaeria bacterium]